MLPRDPAAFPTIFGVGMDGRYAVVVLPLGIRPNIAIRLSPTKVDLMARPHWLRSLLVSKNKTPLRRKPTSRRWAIEELEGRLTPAVSASVASGALTVTLGAAGDSAFI